MFYFQYGGYKKKVVEFWEVCVKDFFFLIEEMFIRGYFVSFVFFLIQGLFDENGIMVIML